MYSYVKLWGERSMAAVPLEAVVHASRSDAGQLVQIIAGDRGPSLFLDGVHQLSAADEHTYHELLVHPAMVRCAFPPRHVLILGGGDGAALREVLRYESVQQVTLVDFDPVVTAVTTEFMPSLALGAWDDPRVAVVHEDVARFLTQDKKQLYDVVIIDLTEPEPREPGFYTAWWLSHIRKHWMHPGAVLGTHTGPVHSGVVTTTVQVVWALAQAFPTVQPYFCSELQWGFAVGHTNAEPHFYRLAPFQEQLRHYDAELDRSVGIIPRYVRQRIAMLGDVQLEVLAVQDDQ